MTSFSKPTPELIRAAVAKLTAPQHERRFFGGLKNPHWIAPLRDEGLFEDPPEPETIPDGAVRCPPWPQSRYLARVAPLAPEEVADILAGLRTKNWLVAQDVVEAALTMPPGAAVRLVDAIGSAAGFWPHDYLLVEVGRLVGRLAGGGEPRGALRLAEFAFAVGDRGSKERRRHEDHEYFEALREHVIPALAVVLPRELAALVLGWMRAVLATGDGAPAGDSDEYSSLWRPAVEEHEQNQDSTFAARLVACVRDAFELAIRRGGLSVTDALRPLEEPTGQVLRRLRLHLLAEFADLAPDLAHAAAMDRRLFGDYGAKHEYARLVAAAWPTLPAPDQARWLAWVDAGPREPAGSVDRPADPELSARQREYWQFQRLHWIRTHLVGERREFYDRMAMEHGEPELADLNVRHGPVRWGNQSPMTVEELTALGFRAAVERVGSWRPDPGRRSMAEPDVEGLAGVFKEYVSRDPVGASSQADALVGRPPIFVRGFLEAMEEAVKKGLPIDLAPALRLARWVAGRPVGEAVEVGEAGGSFRLIDRDWQWTRDAIASLVQQVAQARGADGALRYGPEHREALWAATGPLVDSPPREYIVRDEAEDPRALDWPLIVLNSTRGKAMLAALAYADWTGEHLAGGRRGVGPVPGGLGALPEVRTVLDAELARSEADPQGRGAIGWRLATLHWIDPAWVAAHAAALFDLRPAVTGGAGAAGWAAWGTYLFAHRPHIELYRLLRQQYLAALEQAPESPSIADAPEKLLGRLAEHLMVLFGTGHLGVGGQEAMAADGGIIRKLVIGAPVAVRSRAMQFVGMSLSAHKEPLPTDVLRRFMALWDVYWADVGRDDAQARPQSAVFGYWFSSGAFDPAWSIERLLEFATAAPRAEPDDLIVERLAEICGIDPLRSARVLDVLVRGDAEGWRIGGWKSDALLVLRAAIGAGGEARVVAESVVDRLGRRGFVEFGTLLER